MLSIWRQLQSFSSPWARGQKPLCTLLAGLLLLAFLLQNAFHLLDLATDFELWFGLSRDGLLSGCVWEFGTYGLLSDSLVGLCVIGLVFLSGARELETIIGPKHLVACCLLAQATGGLVHAAFSSQLVMGAWPAAFAVVAGCASILPELELWLPFRSRWQVRYKYFGWIIFALAWASLLLDWKPVPHISPLANLIGAFTGWGYVRLLGFGQPLLLQRLLWRAADRRRRLQRMPSGQFVREKVDPILEKISVRGMRHLTGREKKILALARQKLRRKLP